MQPGDMIICDTFSGKLTGLILDLDDEDLKAEGYMWVKILWDDGKITWEDIKPRNDSLFEVVSGSR